jgi:hypothetical protein
MQNNPERHPSAVREWSESIRPFVLNPHLQDSNRFVKTPMFRDHLMPNAQQFLNYLKEPRDIDSFEEATYAPNLLRNRMLNEMFHESVPPILHEDDHNSMFFSVENRSPFLDKELFEFASLRPQDEIWWTKTTKEIARCLQESLTTESLHFQTFTVPEQKPQSKYPGFLASASRSKRFLQTAGDLLSDFYPPYFVLWTKVGKLKKLFATGRKPENVCYHFFSSRNGLEM